jgi:hypothetical protein
VSTGFYVLCSAELESTVADAAMYVASNAVLTDLSVLRVLPGWDAIRARQLGQPGAYLLDGGEVDGWGHEVTFKIQSGQSTSTSLVVRKKFSIERLQRVVPSENSRPM